MTNGTSRKKVVYAWIDSFEETFKDKIKKPDTNSLKIIIGQCPYKLSLETPKGKKNLKVKNERYPYSDIDKTTAAFVTDWMKIQDTLEMMGNLLFNKSKNCINVLSYLRCEGIKANEFADYLFDYYKIILTNLNDYKGNSNIRKIKSVIEKECLENYILAVGKDASKELEIAFKTEISNNYVKLNSVIHPSGRNLAKTGNTNKQYYTDWYDLQDYKNNIDKFIIFKK